MTLNNISTTGSVNIEKLQREKIKVVKFIHASDIHLGCQQYRNSHLSEDYIKAFQEILSIAKDHWVNFIILGGDVFTSLEMLPGNLLKIINILTDFKFYTNGEIPIIAIEGNHDIRRFSFTRKLTKRGQSWLKLIANLGLIVLLDANLNTCPTEMFEYYNHDLKKGGKIQIKNVVIYGIRYIGQEPVENLSKIRAAIEKKEGVFNILLQHYGIEGQMKNVPGVKIEEAEILKDKVDYLALGHFHRQFIVNDWIYNPGSSEAASSIDASFKRGIFLVEVYKEELFRKTIKIIQLNNRSHQWRTVFISKHPRNKQELYNEIIQKLERVFKHNNVNIKRSNAETPILNLVLRGEEPAKSCKIKVNDLREIICEKFPIVDVKIYQKFTSKMTRLDKFM